MLISGYEAIGQSQKPLSGLVLHYGEGGSGARPCEAAWVGCTDVSGVRPPIVRVYVSRSSLQTMRKVYAPMGVTVEPLLFSEKELDADAILSMMAVGSSENPPLYMQRVLVSPSTIHTSYGPLPPGSLLHSRPSFAIWVRNSPIPSL